MSPISAREKLLRRHFPWTRDDGVECACGVKFPFDFDGENQQDPRSAWSGHLEGLLAQYSSSPAPLVEGASIYGGVVDELAGEVGPETYYSFTPVNVHLFALCEDAADPERISQPWQVLGWFHDESQLVVWPAVLHDGIVQSLETIVSDFADPKLLLFASAEAAAYVAERQGGTK